MKPIDWVPRVVAVTGLTTWMHRHLTSIREPYGPEKPLVGMLSAWIDYAHDHNNRYETEIGFDGVLGPEWAAVGAGIRGLLNGATGSLDCGTLDTIISDNLMGQGFDPEML